MLGTICTADDPEPMTATRLPSSWTLSSQFALWTMDPLKVSLPLIAGHFHLLETIQTLLITLVNGMCQGRLSLLQNSAGIDKDVGFVFDDGIRIIAFLDLDVPHLIFFPPIGTHHSVVQSNIFVQVILLRHIFEILKDLWRA
jgi:hypothetical protein